MTKITITESGVIFETDKGRFELPYNVFWREVVNPRTLYWTQEDMIRALKMVYVQKKAVIGDKLIAAVTEEKLRGKSISAEDVALRLGDIIAELINEMCLCLSCGWRGPGPLPKTAGIAADEEYCPACKSIDVVDHSRHIKEV